jgi:hypothetical protein
VNIAGYTGACVPAFFIGFIDAYSNGFKLSSALANIA